MRVTGIHIRDINAAILSARERNTEQTSFNTYSHAPEEIPRTIPDVVPTYDGNSVVPLDPWLHIIAESQHLEQQYIHKIWLQRSYCRALLAARISTEGSGCINASDEEDLENLFPQYTMDGVKVESLFDAVGYKKLFMRLDTTSLEDARYQSRSHPGYIEYGSAPLNHLWQIWRRLATSKRGRKAIQDFIDRDKDVVVYLFPWWPCYTTTRDYRVFCPPCIPPHPPRISAISQFKWYSPWYVFGPGFFDDAEMDYVAEQVLEGVEALHRRIMSAVRDGDGMKEYGFTFDVFHPEEGEVRLMELNSFGARSGTGSCLFHWIKDADLLYQTEAGEIEFRVCRAGEHEYGLLE